MNRLAKIALSTLASTMTLAAHAQFDWSINPLPIENGFTTVVNIAVPNAAWLPGRNGAHVADGRFIIQFKDRRNNRFSRTFAFQLRKTGTRSALGTCVVGWPSYYKSVPGSRIQVVIRSNGVNRITEIPVR